MKEKQPEIVATITDDLSLDYSIPVILQRWLRTFGTKTKVRVDISKWYKKRTKKQNAYLWAGVYPVIIQYILETTGQKFSDEDLHIRYKRKYLAYDKSELMPDLVKTKSTTDCNTLEFSDEFVEQICVEWGELGLYIPPPKKKDEGI